MNQIYFVGYDGIHGKDFVYEMATGYDCYLLIYTTTPVLFYVNGQIREYPAHTAILYPPRYPIWYAANGDTYADNWLRFSSDESFVTHFPLQAVPFAVSDPEYCYNLFQLLTWETAHLLSPSTFYENICLNTEDDTFESTQPKAGITPHNIYLTQLLRILFGKLREDALNTEESANTCHNHALLSLRRQIAANPQLDWSIAGMSEQLHVSAGYLQLIYKQKFHTSCMDDVINFRLYRARDLLTYTDKNITEIAEDCGYHNTEHFCRQFRKCVGVTPSQFRKSARS